MKTTYLTTVDGNLVGEPHHLSDAMLLIEQAAGDKQLVRGVIYPPDRESGILIMDRTKGPSDVDYHWSMKVVQKYCYIKPHQGRPPTRRKGRQIVQKIDPYLWSQYLEVVPIEIASSIAEDIPVDVINSDDDRWEIVEMAGSPYRRFI